MTRHDRTSRRSGTPATTALDAAGVCYQLHVYEHDPRAVSYGLEAAELLGAEPVRVFKTLVVETEQGPGVAIVPVTTELALKDFARVMGAKRAALIEPPVAERITGYVVGGISPIGQKRELPTVLDRTGMDHPTIFISGGRRGLDIEVAPTDLIRLTNARIECIGRGA